MTSAPHPPHHHHRRGLHGPLSWACSVVAGLGIGAMVALAAPPAVVDGHPVVAGWLVAPFVLLLASIALTPFVNGRFWHRHYPDFAFLLGGLVVGYYLTGFRMPDPDHAGRTYGVSQVLHSLREYYSFIGLVGGLFVVSGGILVDVRGRGRPMVNTVLLGAGAVLANIVGTTGASMLLIRPFMRINSGRLRPIHIVLFIFIVSNCGGVLTPIGDPPLYLGFLKGVPFHWTIVNLWRDWLAVVVPLLAVFFAIDTFIGRPAPPTFAPLPTRDEAGNLMEAELKAPPGLRIRGGIGLACLALMILGVFLDPLLKGFAGAEGFPIGPTFQVLVAVVAYRNAPREILAENDFGFGPVKEVGLLFFGIFLTMAPALAYLAEHGRSLGLSSPTAFYFGTGVLSAVLDNAPTYANFLQIAFGAEPITPQTIAAFLARPGGAQYLAAISTGAVFFGAMTYIGNGPNFMVKAIAESEGVKMPAFFTYLGLACLILLPILVLHWAVLIR